ncbi:MAG: CRISPR-associated ring nuclease Csm6 [Geobacteraceae bacterium]|nr:CRISPR-associated ring nuclease Csm6 [Geobacteraceae bacterium]
MKKILLAVCGLSPQVITETLYALHQQGRMPDAIRILTTREGKAAINANLLDPSDGHYCRFLREYGIDPERIDFSSRHVTAVCDGNGREIDDILGEEENELFLKVCMEAAFTLTSDPGCSVFFSIAGGRKTMGACLTAAAQCYARSQDRIFHVLVSPEFERCREFFYPPVKSVPVELKDQSGNPYFKETRYASVTLIPMPFFSIRDRLSSRHLKAPDTPAALMLSMVREKRSELVVDLPGGKVLWRGRECDLMPAQLALYAFFALLKRENRCGKDTCRGCEGCALTQDEVVSSSEKVSEVYRNISRGRPVEEMSATGVARLDGDNFKSYRSRINKALERTFGPAETERIAIATHGRRPGVRYGIPLDRERIRVVV